MLLENLYLPSEKNLRKGDATMRLQIKNCLATTGLSLVLLAIVATLYNAHLLCIESIYQVFASNVVIHIGLVLMNRFESKYYLLEILIEIGYILLVLAIFGSLFNWYSSTPIGVLILMGIIIYIIGSFIDIFRIRSDVKFINS